MLWVLLAGLSDKKLFKRIEEWIEKKNKAGEIIKEPVPYPIIVIYFLGYIENASLPKVVRLKGNYYDVLNEKDILDMKSNFIELLVHDFYMIQLEKQYNGLNTKPLERILTIFSQQYKIENNEGLLNYPDAQTSEITSDELVQKSLLRLSSAIQDEEVRRQLKNEEDIERLINNVFYRLEDAEMELKEKEKAIEESKRTIEEKDQVIYTMARLLKKTGISIVEIQKQTGMSTKEIEEL